jgi:hypothetical protein
VTYLACAAAHEDPARAEASHPELWREVRRFNLPVKLALAAAHEAAAAAAAPAEALLIALAPCQPGSPELWSASSAFERELAAHGRVGRLRVNPTFTLHAIDNLALSALAIQLGNRAPCLCLGGAAGQAWCGIESVLERFSDGAANEALLVAGDQDRTRAHAAGVAVLFSMTPRPFGAGGRTVEIVAVERQRGDAGGARPHASGGLVRWLASLAHAGPGHLRYAVPVEDGDGVDRIAVVAEVR